MKLTVGELVSANECSAAFGKSLFYSKQLPDQGRGILTTNVASAGHHSPESNKPIGFNAIIKHQTRFVNTNMKSTTTKRYKIQTRQKNFVVRIRTFKTEN